jgi:hypothetical protein
MADIDPVMIVALLRSGLLDGGMTNDMGKSPQSITS